MEAPRCNGIIHSFDFTKNFGFIAMEDGRKVFAHAAAMETGVPRVRYSSGPARLAISEGQPVEFELEIDEQRKNNVNEGRKAQKITLLNKMPFKTQFDVELERMPVPVAGKMYIGQCLWFNSPKGFGMVGSVLLSERLSEHAEKSHNGGPVFVHRNQIHSDELLKAGDLVFISHKS